VFKKTAPHTLKMVTNDALEFSIYIEKKAAFPFNLCFWKINFWPSVRRVDDASWGS